MKIFISVDMEGVAGIVDWSQCRPAGGRAYEIGCALMLGEVNAAIDGALAAGATEVLVNDSHGAMFNLDPAAIRRPAQYLSGRHKPWYMMQGLDETFDAVLFIGYHGSISGESSVLSHTYNPEVISGVRLAGQYVGESGLNALVAAGHAVPIAFVSGDSTTIRETALVAPEVVGVITKESVTRFAARHLHPQDSCERIAHGVRQAVQAVADGRIGPPQLASPAELDIEFATADMAEIACWVAGVQRTGPRAAGIISVDPLAVYRSFVGVTYITRQAGGR